MILIAIDPGIKKSGVVELDTDTGILLDSYTLESDLDRIVMWGYKTRDLYYNKQRTMFAIESAFCGPNWESYGRLCEIIGMFKTVINMGMGVDERDFIRITPTEGNGMLGVNGRTPDKKKRNAANTIEGYDAIADVHQASALGVGLVILKRLETLKPVLQEIRDQDARIWEDYCKSNGFI